MEEKIILQKEGANYFGTEGKGFSMFEIRGNGKLVLTPRGVEFTRLFPSKKFFIPLESIKAVTIGTSHKGKTKMIAILKVHYTQTDGNEAVFGVATGDDGTRWKEEIERLIRK